MRLCARKERWGAAMCENFKEVAYSLTIILLRHQMQRPMATNSTSPSAPVRGICPPQHSYCTGLARAWHQTGNNQKPTPEQVNKFACCTNAVVQCRCSWAVHLMPRSFSAQRNTHGLAAGHSTCKRWMHSRQAAQVPLLPAGRAGRSTVGRRLWGPSRCASQAVQAVLLQNSLMKPWKMSPAAPLLSGRLHERQWPILNSNSRCKRALRWLTNPLM